MIRVLILDDDGLFANMLADYLNAGHGEAFVAIATTALDEAVERVLEAVEHFDVFLIDERLGPGPDGIDVMLELRKHSPDSATVIFARDPQSGMRAYQAGAYRYLLKPFPREEMLWILQSATEHRRTRRERDWHRLLNDVAEEVQRARTFEEVASIAVERCKQFGFERARFWRVSEDKQTLTGVCEQGNVGLDGFVGHSMPVTASPYMPKVLASGAPEFFTWEELGQPYLVKQFGSRGYRTPVGEWVEVPLKAGDEVLAVMSLDNASSPRRLNDEQRDLLKLFSSQIAAALERACNYEKQQEEKARLDFLNKLDRALSLSATQVNLESLLDTLRDMLSERLNVSNFLVVIRDDDTERLLYKLRYEGGAKQPIHHFNRRVQDPYLIPYIVRENCARLLPSGTERFRQEQRLELFGKAAQSFLGVPLPVQGRSMGALVLEDDEHEGIYDESHKQLLEDVTRQVSGVIEAMRLKEKERDSRRRMEVLQASVSAILQLAQMSDPRMWHVALTVGTASYGLMFDRAVLFLAESRGARLRATMGIGYFDEAEQKKDWEADRDHPMTFEDYLTLLFGERLQPTPVQAFVTADGGWQLETDADNALQEAFESGRRIIVRKHECAIRLPAEYIAKFGEADYAVIPIRGASRAIGVVVVDNRFDGDPLLPFYLDNFESLLAKAGLAFESQRERDTTERLLKVNQIVMRWADQPLNDTLTLICQTAQDVAEADSCVIYPLSEKDAAPPYKFDIEDAGQTGFIGDMRGSYVSNPEGLTARVLRGGLVVVEDVERDEAAYSGKRLRERTLIQAERIRAFVGLPIRNLESSESLGVMFVNYRTAQTADSLRSRLSRLESLADLAAMAIQSHRQHRIAEELETEAAQAEFELTLKERELNIHYRALEEALRLDKTEQDVIHALVEAGRQLFLPGNTQADVRLILLDWQSPAGAEKPLRYRRQYRRKSDGSPDQEDVFKVDRGIVGKVLFELQDELYVPDVTAPEWRDVFFGESNIRSELDFPIKSGDRVIGVFNVESPRVDAFDERDKAKLRRLAVMAAQALDNARWRKHIDSVVFKVLPRVVEPIDLPDTFVAIVNAARNVAPDLSLLTIWRMDGDQLKLGDYFGVNDEEQLRRTELSNTSVVWKVVNRTDPIFEQDAIHSDWSRDFVESEGIESFAAFPLRAGNERVGAMFLSYRVRHVFTEQEQALFKVLSDIAASSIRDATLLKKEERAHRRAAAALQEKDLARRQADAALKVVEAVGTEFDLDKALFKIMSALREYFPDAAILTMTYDENERRLQFTNASREFYRVNVEAYEQLQLVSLDGPSVACDVARTYLAGDADAIAVIDDVDDNPRYLRLIRETQSEICIPFANSNRLLGMLVLESPDKAAFDSDAVELIRSAAQQASIAIDRAEQAARLSFHTTVAAAFAWASDVAHDVNREIGAIRRRAYWLYSDESLSLRQRKRANEIDALSQKLVLTVGSSLVGQRGSKAERIDVDDWIEKNIRGLVQSAERSYELVFIPGAGCYADIHPGALLRVFKNLIRNAVKHTPNDGKVFVRTNRPSLDRIEVQIEDEGKGIRGELRHRILQQRIQNGKQGGGMGLIIARSLLEQMGGEIRLLPYEPHRGAVFAFRLPLKSNE